MFTLLFFVSQLFAEPTILEPILISPQKPLRLKARSSDWPTKTEKTPKRINQPQIDDVLNGWNGVQVRTQGSPTFSIRGSAQSGRVLTLYNDIPLNFASGFGAPNILLPKEVFGKATIVKGPASILYGSQAMSGSINFLSRRYERSTLTLGISDTDESLLPWKKGSLAQHSLQFVAPILKDSKNISQFSFFTENDDGSYPFQSQSQSGVRQNNSNHLNRGILGGSHQLKNGSIEYDVILGNQVRRSPGALSLPMLTTESTKGSLVSISPEFYLNDEQSIKLRASRLNTDSEFEANGGTSETEQTTWILQSQWEVEFSKNFSSQVFLDYFHHEMDGTYTGGSISNDQLEIASLFKINLSNSIYIQTGARYINRAQLALPAFGVYFERSNLKSWINYSEGFRTPSISDLYANSPFSVGNPNLKPEKSKQLEFGFASPELSFNPITTYTFSWDYDFRIFYIDYSQFHESIQPTPGIFSKVNIGKGNSRGADLSFSGSWGPWQSSVGYNYLETKNKQSGESFRLSPKHQVSWSLSHYIGPFQLEAQNIIWDTFYDGSPGSLVQLENWNQWNFLLHSFGFRNFNFSVGLLNAFNQSKQLTLNYPEPQRRYWAQISIPF